MKELKRPWVHWHSPAARILDSALAPDDPLAAEPLWVNRSQADEFERAIARPGIQRWTAARIERRTRDGRLTSLPEFMRQVLDTSTINLAASPLSRPALAAAATVAVATHVLRQQRCPDRRARARSGGRNSQGQCGRVSRHPQALQRRHHRRPVPLRWRHAFPVHRARSGVRRRPRAAATARTRHPVAEAGGKPADGRLPQSGLLVRDAAR